MCVLAVPPPLSNSLRFILTIIKIILKLSGFVLYFLLIVRMNNSYASILVWWTTEETTNLIFQLVIISLKPVLSGANWTILFEMYYQILTLVDLIRRLLCYSTYRNDKKFFQTNIESLAHILISTMVENLM